MIDEKSLENESSYRRFANMVSSVFELSEGSDFLYVAILAVLMTFFSMSFFARIETSCSQGSIWSSEHYGFPFEIINNVFMTRVIELPPGVRELMPLPVLGCSHGTSEFMWLGLILNLIIYALPSFVIVRVIVKVKDEINLCRHY